MYVSAFGVEDNRISKKMTERKKKILIAAGAGGGGGLLLAGPLGALAGGGGAAGTTAYLTSNRHRHRSDRLNKAMPDLVGMAGKAGKWVRGEKAAPGTALALRPVHPQPYVRPSKMSTKRALLLGGGIGAVGAGGIAAVNRDNNSIGKAMPDLVGMAGKAGKWVRGEKAAPGTAMALRPVHPDPYVRPSKMSTKRALLLGGGVGAVGAGGIAAVHRDNNR